jgi:ribokinase
MTTPRIAVVGSTNIDLIAYASRIPGPGETIEGERFQMGFGGKGANQAVMARILGADVWMVNCLGDDAYGSMTLDNFAEYGVGTAHVHRVTGSSGVAPIWVEPDGTNRIIVIPGANHRLTPQQATDAIADIDPGVVLGQFEIPQAVTAAGFGEARARGATTILNPAPAADIADELLAVSDWIVPNEVEFSALFGMDPTDSALIEVANRLERRLAVTLGADGCALVDAGAVLRLPAPVVTPTDTTGAGDAFVGAFAYGLATGLDEQTAAALANRCAADSVTRPGTQSSFPTPDSARDLVRDITG